MVNQEGTQRTKDEENRNCLYENKLENFLNTVANVVSFLFQISKLLVVHPKGRLTAEQALEHAWFQGAQVCYLDYHRERKLCFNMYDVLIAYPVLFITIYSYFYLIYLSVSVF